MLKERVKSAILVALMANSLFLTAQIWFNNELWSFGYSSFVSWRNWPMVRLFAGEESYSIPKANLSLPRKIVVNDGSLWVAYYNTDAAFSPIEERTRGIIEAFLLGKAQAKETITYKAWQESLNSPGIYIEYPLSFTPKLLAMVMGASPDTAPGEIKAIRDFIILPASTRAPLRLLVRNADGDNAEIYAFGEDFGFPETDLGIYTKNASGYYEFAFNTLLGSEAPSFVGNEPRESVRLAPLVLFSDAEYMAPDILSANPLKEENTASLLRAFSFNPQPLRRYPDQDGTVHFVENYATIKLYGDGLLEYRAVSPDKGIRITQDTGSLYQSLNSAIDFAEKVWHSVSGSALNVLVTSDLLESGEETEGFVFTFDYYCKGYPVIVNLPAQSSRAALSSGIEIEVSRGCVVSYRQYLREYEPSGGQSRNESFVTALDYFVKELAKPGAPAVIEDLFLGYPEGEGRENLRTAWIAKFGGETAVEPADGNGGGR